MNFSELVQTAAVYALPVLFAVTLHEAARAHVADRLGDKTAASLGRLSFNPIKHIDPLGTILMPLLLHFLSQGTMLFGYAKRLPVDIRALRNPRRDLLLISLAGPVFGLLQALAWALALVGLRVAGVQETFFLSMAQAGVLVNLMLIAFNLVPIPPMDGGLMLVCLLPPKQSQQLARVEPYAFFVVMALALSGLLGTYWVRPVVTAGYMLLNLLLLPVAALLQ